MTMEQKKFFSRRDLIFFGVVLLGALLLFLFFSLFPKGDTALVERNGEVIASQELSALSGPETLEIEGNNGIHLTVTFSPDGAEVSASQCPDQVCVKTGKITRSGETALCLPAQVSVRLTGGKDSADAATY